MVESSIGHIRDLPNRASEIPEKFKKEPWARLGVDVENDFEPLYVVDSDKKGEGHRAEEAAEGRRRAPARDGRRPRGRGDRLAPARGAEAEGARAPDGLPRDHARRDPAGARRDARGRPAARRRAGDAAHPRPALRLRGLARALEEGDAGPLRRPRPVGRRPARRRARARAPGLRLGRLLGHQRRLRPRLVRGEARGRRRQARRAGPRLRPGRHAQVAPTWPGSTRPRRASSPPALEGVTFAVRSADEKPYTRRPAAPFMTSTLQQEASRKLRYTAQTTMRVAQRLYENGYITYMRTDSTTLSESALAAARKQAVELYGADSIPDAPRQYARKVKNAQEAHEAIRPAGDSFRTPKELERELNRDELALYDLIWKRTLASQMADARGLTVSLRLGATASRPARDAEFSASGTVITFRGFLAAYEESRDDDAGHGGGGAAAAAPEARRRAAARSSSSPRATRPRRPRASPRRASCRRSRSAGSAGRRPTRRSSARSSTAATSSSAARRSSRPSSPSRSRACSSSTSRGSSTTTSPRRWRTTSTGSPPATRSASTGCATSTSAATEGDAGLHALVGDLDRDRRARGQHDADRRGHRPPRRPLRPVRRARRGARERARGHGARRADGREGPGAALRAGRRPRARHASRVGPRDLGAQRPLRART